MSADHIVPLHIVFMQPGDDARQMGLLVVTAHSHLKRLLENPLVVPDNSARP
jgi:hypothetical protein